MKAADDVHETNTTLTEGAEDTIAHLGSHSTEQPSDRIEHAEDASGDPARIE